MSGVTLYQADFSGAHITKCNFSRAKLSGANFSGTQFSEVNFFGACLPGADFSKSFLYKANFFESTLIGTNFSQAEILNSNLSNSICRSTNFENSIIFNIQYKSKFLRNLKNNENDRWRDNKIILFTFYNFLRQISSSIYHSFRYNRKKRFQDIRLNGCHGSQCSIRYAQDQSYLEEFQDRHPRTHFIWWLFADCGQSFTRWFLWSVIFAFLFGIIFYVMGPDAFEVGPLSINHSNWYPDPWYAFWKAKGIYAMVYYSVVTFTTLGFGDILPKNLWAAGVVMIEVVLGYIMLGGLITIFADKVTRRS